MKYYRLDNGGIMLLSDSVSIPSLLSGSSMATEITFEEAFKDELKDYVKKEAFDVLNSKYDYLDANYNKLYYERMTTSAANRINTLELANKKLQSENSKLRNALIDWILDTKKEVEK